MAEFHSNGVDDLIRSLEQLASIPPEVQDAMLDAQADVVVQAQRQKGLAYGVKDTGMTLSSIKKGKPKIRKGLRVLYVTPTGKNKKGRRNAEVAFVNNYGTRHQPARPFISDANESSAAATTEAGARVYYKWQESINL